MIIYYNPDCSKCKETVDLLQGHQCSFELRNYLMEPPTVAELKALLTLLGCEAMALVRTKEVLFQTKFADKVLDEEACIQMLVDHPTLIERPIIIDGSRAVIGRPVTRVIEFIGGDAEQQMNQK